MPKSGIKILEEIRGSGREIQKGDRINLLYDVALNQGDVLFHDQKASWTVGDRNFVAGFRYGLEGMRFGGIRKFKASPHLCYRDEDISGVPKNAVLVITIKTLELAD